MGRKRLLTILAGVVAAIGLHTGPAVALDLIDGTELLEIESTLEAEFGEDGLEDGLQLLGMDLDEAVDTYGDGLKGAIEDALDSGEETTDDTTGAVEDGVESTTGTVDDTLNRVTGHGGDGTGGGDGGGDGNGGGGGGDSTGAGGDSGRQVAASGRSTRPGTLSPEEARRFLPAAGTEGHGGEPLSGRDLEGFGRDDFEGPEIAGPANGFDEEQGDWQVAAPQTAEADRQSDAELATVPFDSGNDVPAALKLLAALMVAGAGTVWHLARQEVSPTRQVSPTRPRA